MPLGYLNLGVWLIPAMFGVAYRRRLLGGRAALTVAGVFFAVDVALVHWGPYQLSMVGTGDHHLSNTSPPSLLLAGHAIILSALAIAAARRSRAGRGGRGCGGGPPSATPVR